MEINETILREIISVVVEQTLKNKAQPDFERVVDKSGIIKIKTNTVKCEPFNGAEGVSLKDIVTLEEAPRMGAGIMGIVPSTNPTSTVLYKSMIAMKARNPIVFSPHPSARECTLRAAELMQQAAQEAGAPANSIGCLQTLSMRLVMA